MTERDELLELTGEEIAAAEKELDLSHPVIAAMHASHQQIEEAEQHYVGIIDHNDQEDFVKDNYGFLADAIVQAGPFTLKPHEIVSLWPQVKKTFPSDVQRVAVAGIIASAYAIQDVENAAWEKLPTSFLKDRKLPDEVLKNTDELEQIKMRLDSLQANLKVLRPFQIVDLAERNKWLLDEIQDNFATPMVALQSNVSAALRESK